MINRTVEMLALLGDCEITFYNFSKQCICLFVRQCGERRNCWRARCRQDLLWVGICGNQDVTCEIILRVTVFSSSVSISPFIFSLICLWKGLHILWDSLRFLHVPLKVERGSELVVASESLPLWISSVYKMVCSRTLSIMCAVPLCKIIL